MKKASKIFLIFSGILGIFITIAMAFLVAFYAFSFLASSITVIVLTIVNIAVNASEFDATQLLPLVYLIPLTIGSITFIVVFGCGAIFSLLVTIFSFIGLKKKSKTAINVLDIVFTVLTTCIGLPYILSGIYCLIILLVLFMVSWILFLTPIGWLYLAFIIISLGSLLLLIFSILGNVFAIVARSKEKKIEQEETN